MAAMAVAIGGLCCWCAGAWWLLVMVLDRRKRHWRAPPRCARPAQAPYAVRAFRGSRVLGSHGLGVPLEAARRRAVWPKRATWPRRADWPRHAAWHWRANFASVRRSVSARCSASALAWHRRAFRSGLGKRDGPAATRPGGGRRECLSPRVLLLRRAPLGYAVSCNLSNVYRGNRSS